MNPLRTIALVMAGLAVLAGCSSTMPDVQAEPPVVLKPVQGTDRFEVTLSERSQARLGIATSQVRRVPAGTSGATPSGTAVPYAAVVYDSQGRAWAYTPAGPPRTYVRTAITVAGIDGDLAVLGSGPAVGTSVVVGGAPELLGSEAQIAGEE